MYSSARVQCTLAPTLTVACILFVFQWCSTTSLCTQEVGVGQALMPMCFLTCLESRETQVIGPSNTPRQTSTNLRMDRWVTLAVRGCWDTRKSTIYVYKPRVQTGKPGTHKAVKILIISINITWLKPYVFVRFVSVFFFLFFRFGHDLSYFHRCSVFDNFIFLIICIMHVCFSLLFLSVGSY